MSDDKTQNAWRRHERKYKDNRYVYAVISRRSRGVSIGINVNPGKECNFDCVYCQVNRNAASVVDKVDLKRLEEELQSILEAERNNSLYESAPFDVLSPEARGVHDIAFSGDGEPTLFPHLDEAVRIAARARLQFELNSVKLILLTNAACLEKRLVRAAIAELDRNNGEIWAKLDAGTEVYFRAVNRSHAPFQRILDNILEASLSRPLVIQSLWFRNCGSEPPAGEIESYCGQLNHMLSEGGKLKLIQLYTIARDPAEFSVSSLSRDQLDRIAKLVRARVAAPVEVFYGI
jgi:wyosine [tRNA(Phe)-imidazoG37] synthetase (radical SAM superfamily)